MKPLLDEDQLLEGIGVPCSSTRGCRSHVQTVQTVLEDKHCHLVAVKAITSEETPLFWLLFFLLLLSSF